MSIATDSMTDRLIAELYNIDGKAEIVGGRIVLMSPTGRKPGRASAAIYRSLLLHEMTATGYAYPDNVAFIVDLPNRKCFAPDVAFSIEPPEMTFGKGAPVFAAEVRSEADYGPKAEREISAKRVDYFAAGTRVVWDVDLLGENVIRVCRADSSDQPTIFRRDEIAEAEPAVPGLKYALNELFD